MLIKQLKPTQKELVFFGEDINFFKHTLRTYLLIMFVISQINHQNLYGKGIQII
jgi:hypothetical protein